MPERQEHSHIGESPDPFSQRILRLAHQGLKQTPEFVKRHSRIVGGGVVISGAVIVATYAIHNMLTSRGHEVSDDEIIGHFTEASMLLDEHNMHSDEKAKKIARVRQKIASVIHH